MEKSRVLRRQASQMPERFGCVASSSDGARGSCSICRTCARGALQTSRPSAGSRSSRSSTSLSCTSRARADDDLGGRDPPPSPRTDARVRRARGESLPPCQGLTFERFRLPWRRRCCFSWSESGRPCEGDRARVLSCSRGLVVPAGTRIPIRSCNGSRAQGHVGAGVLVQTMGALVQDSCVLVPPYVGRKAGSHLQGRRPVRSTRPAGARVRLAGMAAGALGAISGALDTLEYPSRAGHRLRPHLQRQDVLGGVGKKLVPAASRPQPTSTPGSWRLLGGFSLIRRGPPCASSLVRSGPPAHPAASFRVATVRATGGTSRAYRDAGLAEVRSRSRTAPGPCWANPVQRAVAGHSHEIDSAFRAAGWLPTQKVLSQRHREVTAAIASRPAITAPVSTNTSRTAPGPRVRAAGPKRPDSSSHKNRLLDSLSLVWSALRPRTSGDLQAVGAAGDPSQRSQHRWDVTAWCTISRPAGVVIW